jgi:hypothetical protein
MSSLVAPGFRRVWSIYLDRSHAAAGSAGFREYPASAVANRKSPKEKARVSKKYYTYNDLKRIEYIQMRRLYTSTSVQCTLLSTTSVVLWGVEKKLQGK